jgi:hypothetical protein
LQQADERIAEQVLILTVVETPTSSCSSRIFPTWDTTPFSHLLGTVGMLLVVLLWLSLLNPPRADHLANSLAGSQHEYKIVLGAALLSIVFSFIAAIRGSKWWYAGAGSVVGNVGVFYLQSLGLAGGSQYPVTMAPVRAR